MNEETLDPKDWNEMAALGHRMVDDMLHYLKTVRDRPAWTHAPQEAKEHFTRALPLDPQAPEQVYQEFLKYVFPYPSGNIHPRFWGWVIGTGTVRRLSLPSPSSSTAFCSELWISSDP